ncbi:uncharacterized protein IUM83_17261 [Phytophthora cinnamomi]|uniref:uncharacterized protein n=1 Tax=Phytophthora cinnamomi TaxID=4785 RepID=UPI00355A1BA7|nr:hypothetical protein IUM83_17261 [Phytophthora cinnamomi]
MAEQHRDLVVDGDVAQALDTCRRLLRTDSSVQRVETAHLVLERLRSGGADDSSDDVNAMLRLLGNYVAPTRELTEEILSLLLFCDHRVLLIHHLPKLTYQSKECVQLVVHAYLELLLTDRSLLVPVLGSLAEMPLDNSEKNTVVEATQSLLDAAVEEDIPAVVQSLLSMVTKSSAPKALARLRTECNRIESGTLSLTMEVIGRYATAGSVALTALLRLIRHVDPLTTFDIILLTFVMGKSAENELAVRTTTSVAQSGRLHSRMMREAATMLPALAPNLIASSVDSLIVLVENRSTAQEEALILLLTIVSQPKKLLLLSNADSVQRTRSARQSLELTDPTLVCLVLNALASLVLNTKKSALVGQLCLAVLHQTFPSIPTPTHFENDSGKFFGGLPLRMSTTMETVTSAFQERVVLKMQRNGGNRLNGGWANELLAKTYGKKYNTRRWISKTEANLLPFFSHAVQNLQDFLKDQSEVNNIDLQAARAEWDATESAWCDCERRDVMLSDDKLVSACRTLQENEFTATLLKDWRPAVSIDRDDDDTDIENDGDQEGSQELDEEPLSEEEDEDADGFIVKSYATNGVPSAAVSVLSGRKKPALELRNNGDLGFPTIVVNFKKQKKQKS